MEAKLFLIDGSVIDIDNETFFEYDDVPAGETIEELRDFYECIMDKGTDPSIVLIKKNKEYHFPRKSIPHFEIIAK